MITIIKPAFLRILAIFYNEKSKKIHLREIARVAGLYGPSVTRCLKLLEHAGFLSSELEGNLKKYAIRKNNKTYLVFESFDIERFEKLPNIRKNAINTYLENLPEKPIIAMVFGSTAKEAYSEASDVDILLIVNKKIRTKEAEKEADALTSIRISTFQITYKGFIMELKLKRDPVIQSAIQTGYPLTNHILYYGVLYNERI